MRKPLFGDAPEPVQDWVLYDTKDGVATISLNRPEKRNAITCQMYDYIADLVRQADEDDDVKVILFKGNGSCFSTGMDLAEVGKMYKIPEVKSGERAEKPGIRFTIHRDRRNAENERAIHYSMKTTISQVHGSCYGFAMYIVYYCDMAIAAEGSSFGHLEQRVGASGTSATMPADILAMGTKKAREILVTGRPIEAEEAEDLGLINKVVKPDQLESEVNKLASQVCLLPRDGLAIGKAFQHLSFDLMGLNSAHTFWYASHPMVYGIKWAPDEYSFLKERRNRGVKGAFIGRDKRFYDAENQSK